MDVSPLEKQFGRHAVLDTYACVVVEPPETNGAVDVHEYLWSERRLFETSVSNEKQEGAYAGRNVDARGKHHCKGRKTGLGQTDATHRIGFAL